MTHSPEFEGGANRRLERVEQELQRLQQTVDGMTLGEDISQVNTYLFEGGKLPTRQTDGAIGYDAYARAIVDPTSKPKDGELLRTTFADFQKTEGWEERVEESFRGWVIDDETNPDRYAIALPSEERCMVGLGFATSMPLPLYYWVAPRSGYAARGITIDNAPGTVDPDYRGEAGALVVNRSGEDFVITHEMRVVQLVFGVAILPQLVTVEKHEDLPPTTRGAGGFGSTGTHG